MQGRRSPMPPMGWDNDYPEPRSSWRKRAQGKAEKPVKAKDLPSYMPGALRYLRPINALEWALQQRAGIKFSVGSK
jgi:hypothetical protein